MGRKNYYDSVNIYNFKNKNECLNNTIKYFLNRLLTMFEWKNLPDTIPARMLEIQLLTQGHVFFTEINGDLYALHGGYGGEPDAYFRPTIYTIANPALKYSANLTIGTDGEIMLNDSFFVGVLPLLRKYGTLLTESELSMKIAIINERIISLISASDDSTKASAEMFIKHIEEGDLSVIAETAFLNGVKAQPYANHGNNSLSQLIEMEQYLKASVFNEIGLNANYNMKREAINAGEAQLNDDMLTPLIDDMLNCRREAVDKINKMYGLDISVDFAGAWEENEIETEAELDAIEALGEDSEEESKRLDTENEEGGTNNEDK